MDDEASISFVSPPGYGYYTTTKSSYNNEADPGTHRSGLPPASELLTLNGHCGSNGSAAGGALRGPLPPDVRQYNQPSNTLPSISSLGQKSQYYYQQQPQNYSQPSPSIPPSPYLNTPSTYYSITEPGTPAPQVFNNGEQNGQVADQITQQSLPNTHETIAPPSVATNSSAPVSPVSTVSNQQRSPRGAGKLSLSTNYQQQQMPLQYLNQQPGTSNRWTGGPIVNSRAPRGSKGGGHVKTTMLSSPMLQLQCAAPPAFGDDGPTVREHLQQQQARQRSLQSQIGGARSRRVKSTSASPQKAYLLSQSSQSSAATFSGVAGSSTSRQPMVYSQGAPYAAAAPPPPSNDTSESRRHSVAESQSGVSRNNQGNLDDTLASTIALVAAGEAGFNPETLLDPSPSNADDEDALLDEETLPSGAVVAQRVAPPSSSGCSSSTSVGSVSSQLMDYVPVDNLPRSVSRKRPSDSYVGQPYRAAPPVSAPGDSRQQQAHYIQQLQQQQRQKPPSQGSLTVQHVRSLTDAYSCQSLHLPQQLQTDRGAESTFQQQQPSQYQLQSSYPPSLQPQPATNQHHFPVQTAQAWQGEYTAQRQMIYAPSPQSAGLQQQSQSFGHPMGNDLMQRWPPIVGGSHLVQPPSAAQPPQYDQPHPQQHAMHSPTLQTVHRMPFQPQAGQVSSENYSQTPVGVGGVAPQRAEFYSAPLVDGASTALPYSTTSDDQVIDETETQKYGVKLCRLKKEIKAMVYTNAALADEVARLHQRIEVVTQERYMLAKRLQHHQRNRIRRIQTKERRRAAARARKCALVEKDASTDATISDVDVATAPATEGENDAESKEEKAIPVNVPDPADADAKNVADVVPVTPRCRRAAPAENAASTPISLSSALASAIGVEIAPPQPPGPAASFSMSLRQRRDTSLGDSTSTCRPKSQNSLADEDEISESSLGKDHRRRTTSLQQQPQFSQKRATSKQSPEDRPKAERSSTRQRSQTQTRKQPADEDSAKAASKRRQTPSKSSSTNTSPTVEKEMTATTTENGISPRTRSATRALSLAGKTDANTVEIPPAALSMKLAARPTKKRHSLEDSDEDGGDRSKNDARAEEENELAESDNDADYRNEDDEADAADDDEEDWNEEKRCFTSLRRASATKRRRRLFGDDTSIPIDASGSAATAANILE